MRNPIRIALIVSVLIIPLSLFGQVDCFEKTLKISRIQGQVFDPQGIPVSRTSITLTHLHDNKPLVIVQVDDTGRFHMDAPSGEYWLTVTSNGFFPTSIPVRVRYGLLRLLPARNIYLILRLGAGIPCPAGTLSVKEFHSTLKKLKEHPSPY
jgi:Carboxypeptidase regulatory-like domain